MLNRSADYRPMQNQPPKSPKHDPKAREERIAAILRDAKDEALPGPCAARSQDFLYDENGFPK